MEHQNESQQEDFCLLQYQKLIDSRPVNLSTSANSIDPALGYNFLVNGVVHCLPFLSKIWHIKGKDLSSVTDEDLYSAGIIKATDRSNILLSIEQFLDNDRPAIVSAASKQDSVSDDDERPTNTMDETGELLAVCVNCMENSVSCFDLKRV
jgi:E3 ubiquitin-protein ligase LRSAM1